MAGPIFSNNASSASATTNSATDDNTTVTIDNASNDNTSLNPPFKPINEMTAVISLSHFKDLFLPNNQLGLDGKDLSLADFLKKVQKLEGSSEAIPKASFVFCYDMLKNESSKSLAQTNLGDLPLDIIKNHISYALSDFDQKDVMRYLVNNVSSEKIFETLEKIGFDLTNERSAIKDFRNPSNFAEDTLQFPEGQSAEDMLELQFGKTKEEHFIRIVKMFNMLPSELLARSTLDEDQPDFINMKWLNRDFIRVYNEIEDYSAKIYAHGSENVTFYGLRSSRLIAVPANIGKLTAMQYLYLQNNSLSTLPPEVVQLKALKHLNLAYNNLTTLPSEVGQLTALDDLNLRNNNLSTLPPELGRLTVLTSLSLYNNNFTDEEIQNIRAMFEQKIDIAI
jgi:Leucine-rich repeat (LRR) protein